MSAHCSRDSGFRVLQCLGGLVGSTCLMYSVCSPYWYGNRGLWDQGAPEHGEKTPTPSDATKVEAEYDRAVEAERVFAVLAFIMAVSGVCISLMLMFCWSTSKEAHSTLNPGRELYPGTLLLVIFLPTGLFFLISWSVFTKRHQAQITSDITQLGSSFWLGFLAWLLMLVFLPVTYVADHCACSDDADANKNLLPEAQERE